MELYDILKQDYSDEIVVDINFSYGHVTILDRANGESVFLQGDEASEFLADYKKLWDKLLPVRLIECHLARPYLGNS